MNGVRSTMSGRRRHGRLSLGLRVLALVALAAAIGPVAGTQAAPKTAARAFTPAPPLQPIDPQTLAGPAGHDVGRLQADPGRHAVGDLGRDPVGAQPEPRARRGRLPRPAVRRSRSRRSRTRSATRRSTRSRAPQVPQFYRDFLATPSALNHNQTLNGYWMEQSGGKVGISTITPYGPYLMPRRLYQYGLNDIGQPDAARQRLPVVDDRHRDADGDVERRGRLVGLLLLG